MKKKEITNEDLKDEFKRRAHTKRFKTILTDIKKKGIFYGQNLLEYYINNKSIQIEPIEIKITRDGQDFIEVVILEREDYITCARQAINSYKSELEIKQSFNRNSLKTD